MKKLLLFGLFLYCLLRPLSSLAQNTTQIFLDITQKNSVPAIDTPNAYDYSATAMNEDNVWQVWTCNYDLRDGFGGDSLFYSSINQQSQNVVPTPVIRHTNLDLSEEGLHVCAPTVIKHNNPNILNNQELYKMYYECAPRLYDSTTKQLTGLGFSQICHAVSTDGITWQKYNEQLWNTQWKYGDINTLATPVIKVADKVLQNCQYKEEGGKKYASFPGNNQACSDAGLNYGVGHPSTIVKDINGSKQIWLYYYDSRGVWADRGVYLTKSWDGFHFETPVKTNLQNPIDIKYINTSVSGVGGYFVGTLGIFTDNYYAYSPDGINWVWPSTPNPDLKFGQALDSHCGAPGQPALVGNKYGILNSPSVNILSAEGFWGKDDGCTNTNGCKCYNSAEDSARGSTWGVYLMQGVFNAYQTNGDLNNDQKVDIFDLRHFLTNFLKSLTVFDYNKLVENFGSPATN